MKIYNSKKNIHRRQDANVVYTLNTNFYLAKVDYILKTPNLLDGKILGVDTPKYESIDIDDIAEDTAECLFYLGLIGGRLAVPPSLFGRTMHQ